MTLSSNRSILPSTPEQALEICLGLVPLFLVTIRSWTSAVLILGAFACMVFMLRPATDEGLTSVNCRWYKPLIILMLLSPVLAVGVSSLLRGSYVAENYDSPSRFMVAVVIFLFALRRKTNAAQYLQYTVPVSLLFTLLHQLFFFQPGLWGPDRMSTYFSDPLVFGYTALTFGLISLVSINLLGRDCKFTIALKLAGAGVGFYLSIMSGSRTGWLAAPLILALWAYRHHLVKGRLLNVLAFSTSALIMFGVYSLSTTVQHRFLIGIHEALNYSWVGIAPETSVGFRITFLRIAWDMFSSSPIAGHGDNGYDLAALPAHVYSYASHESLRMAFNAGFHNEIVSNAVRFGLGGLLAAAMLLLVPIGIFVRQSHSNSAVQRANASLGLVLTVCFFVSSLSTEVFDLKYMASFYAVMVALLCASAIAEPAAQELPKRAL